VSTHSLFSCLTRANRYRERELTRFFIYRQHSRLGSMRSSSGRLSAAFAIALGFALAIGFAKARLNWKSCFTGKTHKPIGKLTRICQGENVEISSIEELRSLSNDAREAGRDCYESDFSYLAIVIAITGDPNVCSQKKATEIANFKDWLDEVYLPGDMPELLLPFRDFFLAYGLKMSALCEETLMKEFTYRPYHIEHLYGSGSPIDRLLTPLIESDAITLPSLVSTVLPMLGDGRVLVQSDHSDIRQLEDAQKVCRLRFRPLYEHFLEPIAILAQSGFAHRSDYFKQFKLLRKSDLDSWTKTIFICELLDSMQFGVEGADRGSVTPARQRVEQNAMDPTIFLRSGDGSIVEAMKKLDANQNEADRGELFVKILSSVMERYGSEDRLESLIELIDKMGQDFTKLKKGLVQVLKLLKSNAITYKWLNMVADCLYKIGAPGLWVAKAAIAGLLLPPGADLHPLG
jgi:hypothetical protein